MIKRETWATVVSISVLPAIWAIVAGIIGIQSAAAMITATVYVMGGKGVLDAVKMSIGIIIGVVAGIVAMKTIAALPLPGLYAVFITLLVVAALLVIIHSFIDKYADLFAILVAFATSMAICNLVASNMMMSYAFQITVAMLVGVWWIGYVGCIVKNVLVK